MALFQTRLSDSNTQQIIILTSMRLPTVAVLNVKEPQLVNVDSSLQLPLAEGVDLVSAIKGEHLEPRVSGFRLILRGFHFVWIDP